MKNRAMKTLALLAALLLAGVVPLVQAVTTDDTEIYVRDPGTNAVPPIVMLYLDYTTELTSNAADVCNINDAAGLSTADLEDLYDDNCTNTGMATLKYYFVYPDSLGASATKNDFADDKIDQFELLRAVLKRVLIGLGDMKIGMMMSHADGDNDCIGPSAVNCSNGGYVLQRAVLFERMIDVMSSAGYAANVVFDPEDKDHMEKVLQYDDSKRELFTRLNSLNSPKGNFSAPNQDKEVYFELFRYLTGQRVYNGHNGWVDLATDTAKNVGAWEYVSSGGRWDCAPNYSCGTGTRPLPGGRYIAVAQNGSGSYPGHYNGDFTSTNVRESGNLLYASTYHYAWDTAAEVTGGGTYISPITDACQRIFMINLVDGFTNGIANESDEAIKSANGGLSLGVLEQNNPGLVTIVRALYTRDLHGTEDDGIQNVTSYFVTKHDEQLTDAAMAGGSREAYLYTEDAQTVVDNVSRIFNQILSTSTTYVAASIPVNVFNRSEVLDNAYLALFQTHQDGNPRWYGNVKKLKLDILTTTNNGVSTNSLRFIDANSTVAIASDGRIDAQALTFWTRGSGYDITNTISVTGADPAVVVGKDGRAVARGGAGQRIPGFLDGNNHGNGSWTNTTTGRNLYTEAVSGDPGSNGLMPIVWANRAYLWPLLRAYGDSYSDALWPALSSGSYSDTWSSTLSGTTLSDADFVNSHCLYTYATTTDTATTPTSSSVANNPGCVVKDIVSNLIAYMRGYDVAYQFSTGNNNIDSARQTARRWQMGDALHSRPLPVNYGALDSYTAANPDIRIIVGSNDGYLRMLRNTTDTVAESGSEVWAFMPREVMKIQMDLMKDEIPSGQQRAKHPYGVDLSPVAFIRDSNGTISSSDCTNGVCDVAWVYAGLRRGGRGYYALNITNPDAPVFKWKITNSTTGFDELGYTFSQPVVRFMNWGGTDANNNPKGPRPVLIFGGGYDFNKDIIGQGTNDSMGRAIYIVDADSGALVWKVVAGASDVAYSSSSNSLVRAALTDSIPSEVAAVDGNGDGLIDRVYVGDTGGKVWRVDLPGQTPTGTDDPRTGWNATVLLNLGRHWEDDAAVTDGSFPNDRRFFYPPDVVPSRDTTGNFDAIVIGSGNREHPLSDMNSDNLFVYKDRNITGVLSNFTAKDPTDLADMTSNCAQTNVDNCTDEQLKTNLADNGWRLPLTANGEKSLAPALTLRGVVYFSTYLPPLNSDEDEGCVPEGRGRFYALNLATAGAVFSNFSMDNESNVTRLTTDDRFRVLDSHGIPSENVYVSFRDNDTGETYSGVLASDLKGTDNLGTQQWRSFWYEKQH